MGRTILPDSTELCVDSLKNGAEQITILVHTTRSEGKCPSCGSYSRRIHSYYTRKLANLPWNGVPVVVQIRTRRFFCSASGCGQDIFTERLPYTAASHARRTLRLGQLLNRITMVLGGAAGGRLVRQIGIVASGDTLLRHLRRKMLPATHTPRVLGIDDWAWRRGHRYGTILCDLELRSVIDLLPDRNGETVEEWLRAHPGIEIVSRDRASAYAEATSKALPDAVQVADRWHLLHNLTEAFQRYLATEHVLLREVAKHIAGQGAPKEVLPTIVDDQPKTLTQAAQIQERNRARRLVRYESAAELVRQGLGVKTIARTLNIDRRTVRRWKHAGCFPERVHAHRHSSVDCFGSYLQQRYNEGCHNAAQLWRELHERGFRGTEQAVRRWVHNCLRPQRGSASLQRASGPKITGSPRQSAWHLLRKPSGQRRFASNCSSARQRSKPVRLWPVSLSA